MSTAESWQRTPREIAALAKVYAASKRIESTRWGIERAHAFNLAGAKHPSGRAWTVDDFIDTPESRARREQAEREQLELLRAQREHAVQMQQMKAGIFDEESLPSWARMTPEEKAARNL